MQASNGVFRMRPERTDLAAAGLRAVYKPVRGERPLQDFPVGTLAHREVAAYLVSEFGGFHCVPETMWFDGPFGPGALQRWIGDLDGQEPWAANFVRSQDAAGWLPVAVFEADDDSATHLSDEAADEFVDNDEALLAEDPADADAQAMESQQEGGKQSFVFLSHRSDPRLAVIAAFDVVVNNADRKGTHVLVGGAAATSGLWGIDHGLTFHAEDKLRTVLWGWAGESLPATVMRCLEELEGVRSEASRRLAPHLSAVEIEAMWRRVDGMLETGYFPQPPTHRYGLPWPPL